MRRRRESKRTVVGGIFLSANQHLWVEELAVGTAADLIDGLEILLPVSTSILSPNCIGGGIFSLSTHRWIEIDEDGARDIFAAAGLGEEGLERAGLANVGGLWVRTTIC